MKAIDINQIRTAKLIKINRNSVVLETPECGRCHRNVYNQIVNEPDDFPCFIIPKPKVNGNDYYWVAIPKTI